MAMSFDGNTVWPQDTRQVHGVALKVADQQRREEANRRAKALGDRVNQVKMEMPQFAIGKMQQQQQQGESRNELLQALVRLLSDKDLFSRILGNATGGGGVRFTSAVPPQGPQGAQPVTPFGRAFLGG